MRLTLPLVAALGATQVIGYGSIYYAFPILAPAVAQEFDVGEPLLFGLLSAGLLLGGLAAPSLGGLIDRIGAGRVMTAGSVVMALLLALLAAAPNIYVFGGLTLLIELFSFAVLYDAAFAMLAQKRPGDTRKAITRLTLIAGFASTIFWPLSGFLVEAVGWRGTQGIFAASHLLCAALHWGLGALPVIESRMPAPGAGADPQPALPVMTVSVARRAFWLLALGFALTGMAISAITVHLVEILRSLALGEMAYVAAMVMGPSQVAVRVMDATVWRNRHPLFVALLSAGAIATAIALLLLPGLVPALAQPLAFAFAAILGAGAGLSSIVRGAVPVALFGASGLGLRLGRLAAIRNLLGASAPFLFAFAAAHSMSLAVSAALALSLAGLAALLLLHRTLRRIGIVPPIRPGRARLAGAG
ncbi:MFS transporter [Frigidibacter albus]|uniref:MFS transporter n=1 Tax=Frigidibacter albus TaxID=1465486 RepID=A0A6L8VH27_9RHOB|nr:MFS transporter [Frigidibacter albus]MZQ88520.1 MFS transporter [Frigidibacter albus]NBE30671.1 MFS transporter [Frigidibacter albus]GGH48843.1 MFS transporter [Frigidibacter albus]